MGFVRFEHEMGGSKLWMLWGREILDLSVWGRFRFDGRVIKGDEMRFFWGWVLVMCREGILSILFRVFYSALRLGVSIMFRGTMLLGTVFLFFLLGV